MFIKDIDCTKDTPIVLGYADQLIYGKSIRIRPRVDGRQDSAHFRRNHLPELLPLEEYDLIVVLLSGGKDSVACFIPLPKSSCVRPHSLNSRANSSSSREPRLSAYLAYQYDVVCNGVELSSGAVRNHNLEIMVKAFEVAGYTEDDLREKFGALYHAFQYGAPPHAGMAPGIDRMVMLLREEENIREVIPFPMNGNAQDLMCGAPGEVTEMQLREVHVKIRQ